MRILLLFLAIGCGVEAFAQQQLVTDSIGSVVIRKDPRLDLLSARQSDINRQALLMTTRRVSGYRIQVINTQNRDEANNVKAEMLRRFPDQKAYLMYKAPNFRVRIGNFLSRSEAETLRKMIAALYSDRGIYLVQDIIEYRPADDMDLNGLD